MSRVRVPLLTPFFLPGHAGRGRLDRACGSGPADRSRPPGFLRPGDRAGGSPPPAPSASIGCRRSRNSGGRDRQGEHVHFAQNHVRVRRWKFDAARKPALFHSSADRLSHRPPRPPSGRPRPLARPHHKTVPAAGDGANYSVHRNGFLINVPVTGTAGVARETPVTRCRGRARGRACEISPRLRRERPGGCSSSGSTDRSVRRAKR
jgi:hypothetical protein